MVFHRTTLESSIYFFLLFLKKKYILREKTVLESSIYFIFIFLKKYILRGFYENPYLKVYHSKSVFN